MPRNWIVAWFGVENRMGRRVGSRRGGEIRRSADVVRTRARPSRIPAGLRHAVPLLSDLVWKLFFLRSFGWGWVAERFDDRYGDGIDGGGGIAAMLRVFIGED
jgi:hypothetical protein